MPHSFPKGGIPAEVRWGRPPGLRGTPSSRSCCGFIGLASMLVAVAEGAILAAHLSSSVRLAFLSGCMFPERSSPSRVRFAAPNNGAPLTAPGRSARPSRQERKALWRTGCRWRHYPNAKMAPFLTATVMHRGRPGGRPRTWASAPPFTQMPAEWENYAALSVSERVHSRKRLRTPSEVPARGRCCYNIR